MTDHRQQATAAGGPLRLVGPATAPPPSVPMVPSPLVGRHAEIGRVLHAVVDEARPLVSITGLGGIGKTRIAIEVAQRLWHATAASIVFVGLRAVTNATDVAAVVAAAAGWSLVDDDPAGAEAVMTHELGLRPTLLVLDNCEQIDGLPDLVARLTSTIASLTVVVTSRRPLDLPAELVVPIDPLDPPDGDSPADVAASDAATLLVQAARQHDPGFAVTRENSRDVADLCRRLDGIPLAIELAGPRLRLISPGQMVDLLARRFDLLRAESGEELLRATIEWSYQALDDDDRRRFRALGVFPETFDLGKATAVIGDDTIAVLDALQRLDRHHFVRVVGQVAGATRFALLETLRAFALAELAARGETAAVRDRHARWCHDLVCSRSTRPDNESAGFDVFDREQVDVRTALDWLLESGDAERAIGIAAELWRYWFARGRGREGLQLILAALELGGASAAGEARGWIAAGELALEALDLDRSAEYFERGIARYSDLGDETGLADARNSLAFVLREQGELERAEALHHESAAVFRRLGSMRKEASCLNGIAAIAATRGEAARAAAIWEHVLDLVERCGDPHAQAAISGNLGVARFALGEHAAALAAHARSLALATEIDDAALTLSALVNRAEVAIAAGLESAAEEDLDRAEVLAEAIGMPARTGNVAHHRGLIAERQGQLGSAFRFHLDGLSLMIEIGHPLEALVFVERLGALAAELGEDEVARACFAAARAGRATSGTVTPDDVARWMTTVAPPEAAQGTGPVVGTDTFAALLPELEWVALAHAHATRRSTDPGGDALAELGLSPREGEVARLLVANRTDAEIAAELYISARTVGSHVSSILRKLGVASRREVGAELRGAGIELSP